jgi:DNA invertase Pin-like site-specific DNA recombinase
MIASTHVPTAYGYGRVSHKDQEAGDSVPAQEARTTAYHQLISTDPERFPGLAWGGFYGEPGHVSAFWNPWGRRPTGKKLVKILQPGDHIIFDKIDRMWRSIDDFVVTRHWFKKRGITAHCVNFHGASFEWESPGGNFFLTMFAAMGEFWSAKMSEDIRKTKERMRHRGQWVGGQGIPCLCKKVSKGKIAWDHEKIALLRRIISLMDQGMIIQEVADFLEQERCQQEGIQFKRSAFFKRKFTHKLVSSLYERRAALEYYPDTDPNTIHWSKLCGTNRRERDMILASMVVEE